MESERFEDDIITAVSDFIRVLPIDIASNYLVGLQATPNSAKTAYMANSLYRNIFDPVKDALDQRTDLKAGMGQMRDRINRIAGALRSTASQGTNVDRIEDVLDDDGDVEMNTKVSAIVKAIEETNRKLRNLEAEKQANASAQQAASQNETSPNVPMESEGSAA